MTSPTYWMAVGQVRFRGTPKELSDILCSKGLKAEPGQYAVRIRDCSHFVLQSVGQSSPPALYDLDADADSEVKMVRDAELVSRALSAAFVGHAFETCGSEHQHGKSFSYDG